MDCQGNIMQMCRNNTSVVRAVRTVQNGLERSVKENFGNALINCMCMGMENIQSKKFSSVIRNSDDFFPDAESGFRNHIIQNAYNSMFLNDLYYLDFDMWWTIHKSNIQSAVLRAISGGPIYISDRVGETDADILMPLINADGEIIGFDSAAVPTPDCVYGFKNNVIKLMNSIGEVSVAAAFNLGSENEKAIFTYEDIKLKSADRYTAYLYFEKRYTEFDKDTVLEVEIEQDKAEIVIFRQK